MAPSASLVERVRQLVQRDRLVQTAVRLVSTRSPTGDAGNVLDDLERLLVEDGFPTQRETATHPKAPAVLARFETGRPGRCLQFNGHVDVVHLPFVPPTVEGHLLKGSGACDMKGGTAAAIEAMRVLRDGNLLGRGSILFVAHDLHEAPWGLGHQLDDMIRRGIHGDAVLIPEPLNQNLPILGRGSSTWKVTLKRSGAPVHEVMRPASEPNVIAAGTDLAQRIFKLDAELSRSADSLAGKPSAFIGQIHSGEIYNQYPQECMLEGTRRWLPGTDTDRVEREFRSLVADVAGTHGVQAECDWRFIRGAFELNADDPFVRTFQEAHAAVSGERLPTGPKLFVDDGNSFSSLARIPAITHGPKAGGQHTVNEWVDIDDLVRVATLYAVTAIAYLDS